MLFECVYSNFSQNIQSPNTQMRCGFIASAGNYKKRNTRIFNILDPLYNCLV